MKRIVKALGGLALIAAVAGCAGEPSTPSIMYEKPETSIEEKKYDLSECRNKAYAEVFPGPFLNAGLFGGVKSIWKFDKVVRSCLEGKDYTRIITD